MTEQHLTVTGDAAELATLWTFLQRFWSANGLPAAEAAPFELALEEVFMNVVTHGAGARPTPPVAVSLCLIGGQVWLTVEDGGPAFDPLSLPAPDVGASLEDRPIGGLGVFLVRQVMDEVHYRRCGVRNQLRMARRVGASRPAGDPDPPVQASPESRRLPGSSLADGNGIMFEIRTIAPGTVALAGRLDATHCEAALKTLDGIADLGVMDLAQLEYIASAGLRVILLTHKRCKAAGAGVRLVNVTKPVHDILHYAGFDQILDITRTAGS